MMPAFLDIANIYSTGDTSDYWIGATQFDPPNNFGVHGVYGGNYSDFVTQFTFWNGIAPQPLATISGCFSPTLILFFDHCVNISLFSDVLLRGSTKDEWFNQPHRNCSLSP
jgi:hypothetical protein